MKTIFLLLILSLAAHPVSGSDMLWVSASKLARHTCPAHTCGVIGELTRGEQVIILEEFERWARITIPYMASCRDGVNLLVQRGNTTCSKENGAIKGYIAEWIEAEFLTTERPPEP